jgi:hypothetical protein
MGDNNSKDGVTTLHEKPIRELHILCFKDGRVTVGGTINDNPLTLMDIFAGAMKAIISHKMTESRIIKPTLIPPNIG